MTFFIRAKALAHCFGLQFPLPCIAEQAGLSHIPSPDVGEYWWCCVIHSWFTLGSFRAERAVSMQRSTGVLTQINLTLFLKKQRSENLMHPEIVVWKYWSQGVCEYMTYRNTSSPH